MTLKIMQKTNISGKIKKKTHVFFGIWNFVLSVEFFLFVPPIIEHAPNSFELHKRPHTRSVSKNTLMSKARQSRAGNNSLRVRMVIAYNFLQENNLIPSDLYKKSTSSAQKFSYNFEKNYRRINLIIHKLLF